MGLLHISLGLLLTFLASAEGTGCSSNCGCIYTDDTDVRKEDYVFGPLRSEDYNDFVDRAHHALDNNFIAYTYIASSEPDPGSPPDSPGDGICNSVDKHIFGYFKDYGLTFCYVIKPISQRVKKTECCSTEVPPCGRNTRCVPGGYARKRYLVFCDAIFRDYDGCLIIADKDGKRAAEEVPSDDKTKRDWVCPESEGYFAFRDDFLPTTCTAKECNCG